MSNLRLLSAVASVLLVSGWLAHATAVRATPEVEPVRTEAGPSMENESSVRHESTQAEDDFPGCESSFAAGPSEEPEPDSQAVASDQATLHLLTLEEAINRALEANRSVLNARDGMESARLSIVSAESEFEFKFIPLAEAGFTDGSDDDSEEDFGAGISVQKRFPTGTAVALEPNVQKTGDTYQTRIDSSLSQPLLRGRDREFNLSRVHGAEFGARSARRSHYLTRVNTVLSTVRGTYGVVRQRELTRINEESVSRLQNHAKAARVKEKIGLATPIDVYRAEIELKQSEDNLASIREAYKDAKDSLKIILAFAIEDEIDVSAPLEHSAIHTNEREVMDVAFRHSVELKQAWDSVREAERRSRVAKHGILPELNIGLSFTPFGTSDDFGAELDEYAWGITLSSTTDIRRTAERAAYEQSALEVDAAYRNMSLTRDEVALRAKSALRSLNEAEQRIRIQEEQIKQAEGKLKLAQAKFKRGMANNFDLIEAEEQLRDAETTMIGVVIDHIVGSYDLRAAMGTLLEQPEGL